jgi:hypothetical protein
VAIRLGGKRAYARRKQQDDGNQVEEAARPPRHATHITLSAGASHGAREIGKLAAYPCMAFVAVVA